MAYNLELAEKIFNAAQAEKQALEELMQGGGDPNFWAKKCKSNLSKINEIVGEHGWPSVVSLQEAGFSEEQAQRVEAAAFLMVQHGDANNMELVQKVGKNQGDWDVIDRLQKDSPEVFADMESVIANQKICLQAMEEGGANPKFKAFVTDRIARNECREQEYGTQFVPNPISPGLVNKSVPAVDENRRQAGFPTISVEEYRQGVEDSQGNVFFDCPDEALAVASLVGPFDEVQYAAEGLSGAVAAHAENAAAPKVKEQGSTRENQR